VANRTGAEFQAASAEREALFRKYAFKGSRLDVREPYWGQFGANPKFDFACIPKEAGTALAVGGGLGGGMGGSAGDDAWLQAAKADFLAVAHIHQRQQLFGRTGVAVVDLRKNLRNVAHGPNLKDL